MGLRFRYEVVDAKTGGVVLRNEATLTCADQPSAGPAPRPVVDASRARDQPFGGPWKAPSWTPSAHWGGGLNMVTGGVIFEPRGRDVYGIYALQIAVHYGALWVPVTFGFGVGGGSAADVFLYYGLTGVGLRTELGPSVEAHVAPVVRGSSRDGGDIAITFGLRGLFNPRNPVGMGWTVDATAPVVGDRWWLFNTGFGLWFN